MAHAAAGDLHKPEVLAAQARRMLQDGHIRNLATEFAGNWLDVRRFEEHNAVDRERFPELHERAARSDVRGADPLRDGPHPAQRLRPRFPLRQLHVRQPGAGEALRHAGAGVGDVGARRRRAEVRRAAGCCRWRSSSRRTRPGCAPARSSAATGSSTACSASTFPRRRPTCPVLPTDETKLGDLTLRETLAQHRANPACASCHAEVRRLRTRVRRLRAGRRNPRDRISPGGRCRPTRRSPTALSGAGLEGLRAFMRARGQAEFVDNLVPPAAGLRARPQPAALGRTAPRRDAQHAVVARLHVRHAGSAHRRQPAVPDQARDARSRDHTAMTISSPFQRNQQQVSRRRFLHGAGVADGAAMAGVGARLGRRADGGRCRAEAPRDSLHGQRRQPRSVVGEGVGCRRSSWVRAWPRWNR